MTKTVFAFRPKEGNLWWLYWALHPFCYHKRLKTEIMGFEEGEMFASAEGTEYELEEAFRKVKRQTKTFRIVSRS